MRKTALAILMTILGVQLFASGVNSQKLIAVTQQWNSAKNTKNTLALSRLYSPKVLYYRSMLNVSSVLKDNARLFAKYPKFKQTIKNINIGEITSNIYNVSFDKYVQIDPSSETKIYPSYLMLRVDDGGRIVIAEEGDKVTDKNIAKRKLSLSTKYNFKDSFSIAGKVYKKQVYGPPGYGETPHIDEKRTIYILKLSQPVIFDNRDGADEFLENTMIKVDEIQLVLSSYPIKLKNAVSQNKNFLFKGTFFGHHTGHHYRKILMDVESYAISN